MKLGIAALALALTAGMAHGATTGFSLSVQNAGQPNIVLTNTGDMGEIIALDFMIGDINNNFDTVKSHGVVAGSLGFTLITPDLNINDGIRSDVVSYSFTGFGLGDAFRFDVDPDPDNVNTFVPLREGVLNGGSATVTFAGGLTSSLTVDLTPGAGEPDDFIYTAVAAVPLPASLPMVLVGLGALGVMRRKAQ